MRIDINRVEGNALNALNIAQRFLKDAGFDDAYVKALAKDVFSAGCAAAQRKLIEERTGGAVTFYDSSK